MEWYPLDNSYYVEIELESYSLPFHIGIGARKATLLKHDCFGIVVRTKQQSILYIYGAV